jgi:hypothetical protein
MRRSVNRCPLHPSRLTSDPRPRTGRRPVPTPWGPVALALLAGLAAAACSDPARPGDGLVAEYDLYWSRFDESYPHFLHKGIDWDSLGAVHRPAAEAASTIGHLVDALMDLAIPLRDRNAYFVAPDGARVPTWAPEAPVNWDRDAWNAHMLSLDWVQKNNWGYAWIGDIAYLTFGSWDPDEIVVAEVDAALDSVRDAAALILDVRTAARGDEDVAFQVAGRFADASRVALYESFRDGPGHGDLSPPSPRSVEPRGSWQYTGPVVVLAGRGAVGSAEAFIAAMRELPHVTIMGEPTGGSVGDPAVHPLGGGWLYAVPRRLVFTADTTVIEGEGIRPDTLVRFPPSAFNTNRDPLIQAAASWLGLAP